MAKTVNENKRVKQSNELARVRNEAWEAENNNNTRDFSNIDPMAVNRSSLENTSVMTNQRLISTTNTMNINLKDEPFKFKGPNDVQMEQL